MIKIERYKLADVATQYSSYVEKIGSKKTSSHTKIYEEFSRELSKYILAPFSEYENLIKNFDAKFDKELLTYKKAKKGEKKNTEYGKFITYMEGRYSTVMQYHINEGLTLGNWLAQELDVNTCPYCNRQYTFTINSQKKTKPQFDHFYPKSKYPFFALSFYNLIPCCSICNHIKKDSNIELVHPYYEGFDDIFHFDINHRDFKLNNKKIKVKFRAITSADPHFIRKCKNNVREFALEELYQKHTDYIEEIIEKAYAYSDSFYEGLIKDFSRIGKSKAEIDRLVFGNYTDLADNEKRPLSKLTRDLLNNIGLKD